MLLTMLPHLNELEFTDQIKDAVFLCILHCERHSRDIVKSFTVIKGGTIKILFLFRINRKTKNSKNKVPQK